MAEYEEPLVVVNLCFAGSTMGFITNFHHHSGNVSSCKSKKTVAFFVLECEKIERLFKRSSRYHEDIAAKCVQNVKIHRRRKNPEYWKLTTEKIGKSDVKCAKKLPHQKKNPLSLFLFLLCTNSLVGGGMCRYKYPNSHQSTAPSFLIGEDERLKELAERLRTWLLSEEADFFLWFVGCGHVWSPTRRLAGGKSRFGDRDCLA